MSINKLLTILFTALVTSVYGQKDTLYFDAQWRKTIKDSAKFYRPIPLKKINGAYLVKDYYNNGGLQMEGFYTTKNYENLEGQTKWYYPTGQLNEVRNYKKGRLTGKALYYSKKGFLRAKGIYKDNEFWSGTFLNECCYNGYILEYEAGEKVGKMSFHENSEQLAVKMVFKNDSTVITNYFNIKGEQIGNLLSINQIPKEGMVVTFYSNDEDDIIGIKSYYTYKNGDMNGEEAVFTKEGKQLAKGNNKNDKAISGTILRSNIVKTYIDGKLDGYEIGYSDKMIPISRGINKDNARWQGQFIELYKDKITSYDKGKIAGKQLTYYKGDFEILKSFHHILNEKKEGESIYYNKEGNELAKGIYKNDSLWNGTFYNASENMFSSYKNGQKHGMFIEYDSKGEIISQQE